MPSRVYPGRSKYEWRPKGGKTVPLCPLDSTPAEVWKAYENAIQRHEDEITVQGLAERYFASSAFLRRRPRTQGDYLACWEKLKPGFGKLPAAKVRPKHVREYMDIRGQTSEVRANREKAVLQNIFAHGFERGMVPMNPCQGVKPYPEKARDRYIEDDEYYQFLNLSTPAVQIFMELSYLMAARGQDVRKIKLSDLRDEGIYIRQEKTGKQQTKGWTPWLREVVQAAMERRRAILEGKTVDSMYLVVNRWGQPYTADGLKTLWAKNKSRIAKKHGIEIDWTFHDIKAKSISDYEGDKQGFSGHKSRLEMEKYDRKPAIVKTLNPADVRK